MRKLYHLFFLVFLSFPARAENNTILKDNLIYQNINDLKNNWHSSTGKGDFDFLQIADRGIQLTDITGDCYAKQNNEKAVLLRHQKFESDYYFQVQVDKFIPAEIYGQVGLVMWSNSDNYIRTTLGFMNPGLESLGEFDGKPESKALTNIYPKTNPQQVILRMEVRKYNVTAFVSWDKNIWYNLGGFVLLQPEVYKIGIIGVGGRMQQPPVFSNWEEGKLSSYVDNEFNGNNINPNWKLGQTNIGWSTGDGKIYQQYGKLFIAPFPGSDFFIGNETYPYLSIPTPDSATWELEIKLARFNPFAKGTWNKAGFILWLGYRNYVSVSAVEDEISKQMYCESIYWDNKYAYFGKVHDTAFRKRRITDVYFRIQKAIPAKYRFQVSYNHKDWIDCGEFDLAQPAAELRLFASGDIFLQHPKDYDFIAVFDYVRKVE